MSETIRLTTAQTKMCWLAAQTIEDSVGFNEGIWAILGHGNVAGLGEALRGIGAMRRISTKKTIVETAKDIADLEARITAARERKHERPTFIVAETDPAPGPDRGTNGGNWWGVAVPKLGDTEKLSNAHCRSTAHLASQNLVN